MKWSELPQEYRDLENTFDKQRCHYLDNYDRVIWRFTWDETPQGGTFWCDVDCALKISELPQIPNNDK